MVISRNSALNELLPIVDEARALAQKYDVVITNLHPDGTQVCAELLTVHFNIDEPIVLRLIVMEQAMKIRKYVKQRNVAQLPNSVQGIIRDQLDEANRLERPEKLKQIYSDYHEQLSEQKVKESYLDIQMQFFGECNYEACQEYEKRCVLAQERKVYGDSKFFENETLQPVCKMLRKYSDRSMENEMVDEILLDFHIAKEPQKLCIRGKVIINVSGKAVDISGFPGGIEFLASDLVHVQSVHLMVPEFMTIENRTSYLRYHADDIVTFYLGGFADRYQRDFLKLVYLFNQDARYKHFGDIDAGVFWIHHNLCEVTEVDFELFGMSVNELQNMEYTRCLHQLSHNDRARLQELKEMDTYAEVINYMLEQDVKLEQEIVSLTLMNGKYNF